MKYSLVFLLFCLTAFAVQAQEPVSISGKVSHPTGDSLWFVGRGVEKIGTKLAPDGSYSLSFYTPKPQFLNLLHGKEYARLFVSPGDKVELFFDMSFMDSTLNATGKNADNYNYWRENFLDRNTNTSDNKDECWMYMDIMDNHPEWSFTEYVLARQKFLVAHPEFNTLYLGKHKNVSPEFVAYLEEDDRIFEYQMRFLELDYFFESRKIARADFVAPKGYFDFVDSFDVNDENKADSYEGYAYLSVQILKEKTARALNKPKCNNVEAYNYATKLFTNKRLWAVRTTIVEEAFYISTQAEDVAIYEDYLKNAPKEQYADFLQQIESGYKIKLAMANGQKAPNFSGIDQKGKKVSLSDFQGKVVYLDFWATWCGPCIAELKSEQGHKTKSKFKKEVVFLTVCLDESEKNWKKMLKDLKIEDEGTHVFIKGSTFEGEVEKLYGINSIPAFFIIGKEGTIFSNSPKRPSNKDLEKDLKKALELKK